jgi:hypothetical protein
MRFYLCVLAAVLAMLYLSGCAAVDGGHYVVMAGGDYETAQVGGGYRCANGVEVGGRLTWWEQLEDETIGLEVYAGVPVDPNTLGVFGLEGSWEVPFGAEIRAGASLGVDFEESNPYMAPLVMVELWPDAAFSPMVEYRYQMFGSDLGAQEGFEDTHKVYLNARYLIRRE